MKRCLLFYLLVIALSGCSKKDPSPAASQPPSVSGPVNIPPGPAEIISIDAVTFDRADVTFTVAAAATMTESGVCWGTGPQPDVSTDLANLFIHNNSGHTFSSSATGLKRETKYFIRAYARSAEGTVMGKVHAFTTPFPGLIEWTPWEANANQLSKAYLCTDSNMVGTAFTNQWSSTLFGYSTDEGNSWAFHQNQVVRGSRTLSFSFAGDAYQLLTDSGVFAAWSRWNIPIAFMNKDVRAISGNRKVMLACTATQIFKLTFSDAEYKSIPVQFPSDSINAVIMKGNDVYLGTNAGIYKGTADNSGWKKVSNEPTAKLFRTKTEIISYTKSGAINRSSDNGTTWTSAGSLANVIQVCGDGPNLFAVCKNSKDVFVSKGDGTWAKFGASLPDDLFSIAITENHLIVSTSSNNYRKRLY